MGMQWVLAAMIVVPLAGGIAISLIPEALSRYARSAAFVISGAVLAASVWLWATFRHAAGMQFELNLPWIPGLGTGFHIGVDGMSLPMVFLTALLTLLAVVASRSIEDRVRQYFTLLLLLEAGLIGVFV
jgi:NADH-quinone oxidoreductase subunit M